MLGAVLLNSHILAGGLVLKSSSVSPQAFTPDGNGISDTVTIHCDGTLTTERTGSCAYEIKIEIKDANGKRAWHVNMNKTASSPNDGAPFSLNVTWDGTGINKKPLGAGTYYPLLKWLLCDGSEGTVQLPPITLYFPGPGEEVGQVATTNEPIALSLPQGQVLTVPAGVVPDGTQIVLRKPADSHGRWNAVEVLPDGLALTSPAILSIPYDCARDMQQAHPKSHAEGLLWNARNQTWEGAIGSSTDAASKRTDIPLTSFSTYAAATDTTPPAAISAAYAQQGDGVVGLIWKASASTDVVSYTVYRKYGTEGYAPLPQLTDVPIAQLDSFTLNGSKYYEAYDSGVSGLTDQTCGDPYTYCIKAKDAAGNEATSCGSVEPTAVPHAAYQENSWLVDAGTRVVDQQGIGDLNNDGYPDFVGWSRDDTSLVASIVVLPVQPDAVQFGSNVIANAVPAGTHDIVVRDFNGDGNLDVAFCMQGDGTQQFIRVLLGNGDGTMRQGTDIALPSSDVMGAPRHLDVADLDNDGRMDLLVLFDGQNPLWLAHNTSIMGSANVAFGALQSSGFTAPSPPSYQAGPVYCMAIGDVNGDSLSDIVLGAATYSTIHLDFLPEPAPAWYPAANAVLINMGGMVFEPRTQPFWQATGVATLSLSLVDLDGDGGLDLLEGVAGGPMNLYRNTGDGIFGAPVALDSPQNVESIVTADLDHDGDQDVIVTTRTVRWVRDCKKPAPLPLWPRPLPLPCHWRMLVTGNNTVLRNIRVPYGTAGARQGQLINTGELIHPSGTVLDPTVALADFDGDGDLDILAFPLDSSAPEGTTAVVYSSLESTFPCTGADTPPCIAFSPSCASPSAPSVVVRALADAYRISIATPANADDVTPAAALTCNIAVSDAASGAILYGTETGASGNPGVGASVRTGAFRSNTTVMVPRQKSPQDTTGANFGGNFKVMVQAVDGMRARSAWYESASQSLNFGPPTISSAIWQSGGIAITLSDLGFPASDITKYTYTLRYGFSPGDYTGIVTGNSPATSMNIPVYGTTTCASVTLYVALVTVETSTQNQSIPSEAVVVPNATLLTATSISTLSGTQPQDITLTPDYIYQIGSGLTFQNLTIVPGTVIQFTTTSAGISVRGNFTARGAACAPITFTSDNPALHTWGQITLHGSKPAAFARVVMANCVVKYGGGTSRSYPMIWAYGYSNNQIQIHDTEIANSKGYGIELYGGYDLTATFDLNGLNVHDNGNAGAYLYSSSPQATKIAVSTAGGFSNMRFTNNAGPAVEIYGNTTPDIAGPGTVSASNNTVNGIQWDSGYQYLDATLYNVGLPYLFNGGRYVGDATRPALLSVQPGVVVKFASGAGLTVNGSLEAIGTAAAPTYFTSIKDDVGGDTNNDGTATAPSKGDWGTITVHSSKPADTGRHVTFSNCVVKYGGGTSTSYPMIWAYGYSNNQIQIHDTEIANSKGYGIELYGGYDPQAAAPWTATFDLNGLNVHDNGGAGAYLFDSVSGYSYPSRMACVFRGCSFLGNNVAANPPYQVVSTSSPVKVDAAFCYWGANDLDSLATIQAANAASTISPWLISSPPPVLPFSADRLWTGDFNPTASGAYAYKTNTRLRVESPSSQTWNWSIKNPGGTLVRGGSISGGALDLTWDGKDTSGNVVPDGKYILTVDDGSGQNAFRADVWVDSNFYFVLTCPDGVYGNLTMPQGSAYQGILAKPSTLPLGTWLEDWSGQGNTPVATASKNAPVGSKDSPADISSSTIPFVTNGAHHLKWYALNTSNPARSSYCSKDYEQANIFVRVADDSRDLNRNTNPGGLVHVVTDATGLAYLFTETVTINRKVPSNSNTCVPPESGGSLSYLNFSLTPVATVFSGSRDPVQTSGLFEDTWDGTVNGVPQGNGLYAAVCNVSANIGGTQYTATLPLSEPDWLNSDGGHWEKIEMVDSTGSINDGMPFSYGRNLYLRLSYLTGMSTDYSKACVTGVFAAMTNADVNLATYLHPVDGMRSDSDGAFPRIFYWDGVLAGHHISTSTAPGGLVLTYDVIPQGSHCATWAQKVVSLKAGEFVLSGFYYVWPVLNICPASVINVPEASYTIVKDAGQVTVSVWPLVDIGQPAPSQPVIVQQLGALAAGNYVWPDTGTPDGQSAASSLQALAPGFYEIEVAASNSSGMGNSAKQTFEVGR
jgi:flagellar hook assembly protein FlgD